MIPSIRPRAETTTGWGSAFPSRPRVREAMASTPSEDGPSADQVRIGLYYVLAQLYDTEMTLAYATELHQAGFFVTLNACHPEFKTPEAPDALDLESLAVEFARLFLGPGPRTPPYGSVFREDDERPGELWGTTTAKAKRFMAQCGIEPTNPGAVPDHISVLFEFMAKVLQAGVEAGAEGDEVARRAALKMAREFFRAHIHPWVETFLRRVRAAQPLSFYRAVIELTAWLLDVEREEYELEEGLGTAR